MDLLKRTNMAEDIYNREEDNLLPEYGFDYTQALPNRFAQGIAGGSLVVVLEPESPPGRDGATGRRLGAEKDAEGVAIAQVQPSQAWRPSRQRRWASSRFIVRS